MITLLYPKLQETKGVSIVDERASVIIPFRNEKDNLPELMKSLLSQQHSGPWEVILVNDHSDDGGAKWLEEYISSNRMDNFQLRHNPTGVQGKKDALANGIKGASGEIIVQTDADCQMGSLWLKNILSAFDGDVEMVLGPVSMNPLPGFWSHFAALEFMSLQASGAAFALGKIPIMGSAANMAYKRAAWQRFHREGDHISSGDDVFLVQAMAKESPQNVRFTLNSNSQTYTEAPVSFKEFINQRARWGSKTTSYKSSIALLVAGLVAGLSLVQCAVVILALFKIKFLLVFLWVTALKALADYLFLRRYSKLTRQEKLLSIFLPATLVYPFYICSAGIAMLFKTEWKGRKVKKS